MNIFILDTDQYLAAQYHVDAHVGKMMCEAACMLSTTCRLHGMDAGYKSTHIHHPCTKWVGESLENFLWLKSFTFALNKERKHRRGHTRDHGCYLTVLKLPTPPLESKGLTPFAQAMPDDCKDIDAVQAYRRYYIKHKQHLFKWTNRPTPWWIKYE